MCLPIIVFVVWGDCIRVFDLSVSRISYDIPYMGMRKNGR